MRNIGSDRVPSAAIAIPVYRSISAKVHLTTIKASVRHFLEGNDLSQTLLLQIYYSHLK